MVTYLLSAIPPTATAATPPHMLTYLPIECHPAGPLLLLVPSVPSIYRPPRECVPDRARGGGGEGGIPIAVGSNCSPIAAACHMSALPTAPRVPPSWRSAPVCRLPCTWQLVHGMGIGGTGGLLRCLPGFLLCLDEFRTVNACMYKLPHTLPHTVHVHLQLACSTHACAFKPLASDHHCNRYSSRKEMAAGGSVPVLSLRDSAAEEAAGAGGGISLPRFTLLQPSYARACQARTAAKAATAAQEEHFLLLANCRVLDAKAGVLLEGLWRILIGNGVIAAVEQQPPEGAGSAEWWGGLEVARIAAAVDCSGKVVMPGVCSGGAWSSVSEPPCTVRWEVHAATALSRFSCCRRRRPVRCPRPLHGRVGQPGGPAVSPRVVRGGTRGRHPGRHAGEGIHHCEGRRWGGGLVGWGGVGWGGVGAPLLRDAGGGGGPRAPHPGCACLAPSCPPLPTHTHAPWPVVSYNGSPSPLR